MNKSRKNETRRGGGENRATTKPGRVKKVNNTGGRGRKRPHRKPSTPVSGKAIQERRPKTFQHQGYLIPSLCVEDSPTDEDALIDVEGDDSTVPLFQLKAAKRTPPTLSFTTAFSSSNSSTSSLGRITIPTPSFRLFTGPPMGRADLSLGAFSRTLKVPTIAANASLVNDSLEVTYSSRHRPLELAERRARKREAELDRYMAYISRLKREAPELWSKKSSF